MGQQPSTSPSPPTSPPPSQGYSSQGYSLLSDRELDIVELVAVGLTNEKIADQLDISKRTVDNHISNILNKTSTHNRVELVRWALQWGKVCLDQINCCILPNSASILNADAPKTLAQDPEALTLDSGS